MIFSETDKQRIIARYTARYKEFGNNHKALGWSRANQEIRFLSLTSLYSFKNKSILDIGCGFGDFYKFLKSRAQNFNYTGIDIVKIFIEEAETRYSGDNAIFKEINILDYEKKPLFDYAIASGIFNYKLEATNNYEFVEAVIEKTLSLTRDGLAFDFLSDRVDYKNDILFYNNPERILSIGYKFSKNIILKNDYMPFEFSLFIFKKQTFDKQTLAF